MAGEQADASNRAKSEVTSSQEPAVFRSSSNLVQVSVVARNSGGQAVGTLKAEDFEVFDNGKPETISRFSVEKFDTSDASDKRTIGQGGASQITAAPLADRYVAMLLDDVSLSVVDLVEGRNAALHYLDTLRPDERVAVYSASGKTSLDFTGDREKVRKTLESINSVDTNSHYRLGDPRNALLSCRVTYYTLDMVLYQNNENIPGCKGSPAEMWYIMQNWGEEDETAYFRALKDMVAKMSVLPGWRSILLLSPGIYVPARYRQQFKDVLAGAIHAQVVISAVDPRGVIAPDAYTAEKRLAPGGVPIVFDEQQGGDFLGEITSGTGGIYNHDNDLDGGVQRAESIPEYVYLLAFTPSDVRFDGKRHELKVALKNPRGLTLQARSGYFADTYSADPADDARREIEEAFFSSKELNDVPVRLRTKFFKDGDMATLTVTTNVDASKLTFRKEDGRNLDNLTMVLGLFDQNGNFISAIQKDLEMQLKDATLHAWIQSGIPAATDFKVAPGRYLVRVVVRDSEGVAMAEQSTGVEIPR
jgi:VWFA-related protein